MDSVSVWKQVETMLAAVQGLPVGIHLLVGAGFVAGMILWLAGGRVVQPAFVVLGSLAGAWVGAVVAPAFISSATVMGYPAVYAGLGGGLVVGLVLSLIAFKVAMGVSAGVVFAAIGVVGATITLARTPGALPEPSATEQAVQSMRDAIKEQTEKIRAELRESKGESAEKVHVYAEELREELKAKWETLPAQSRKLLGLSAAGGFVLGLLLGLAAPKKCAMLVTAMFGGGAVLASGYWLMNAMNPELAQKVQMGPMGVAIVWVAVSLVGMMVQWQGGGKPAPKPAAA